MIDFDSLKQNLLKKKIELEKRKAYNSGRFSLFQAQCVQEFLGKVMDYDKLKAFYKIILEADEMCNIPYNVGVSIDKLSLDNTVLFHRTHLGVRDNLGNNKLLYSIMKDGLKNFGHLSSGAIDKRPPLALTTSPLKGLTGYLNFVSPYKNNDTIILMVFPRELVNEDGELVNESDYQKVYDIDEYPPKIKSEYIIGAIVKKGECLSEAYSKDEIIKIFEENNKRL